MLFWWMALAGVYAAMGVLTLFALLIVVLVCVRKRRMAHTWRMAFLFVALVAFGYMVWAAGMSTLYWLAVVVALAFLYVAVRGWVGEKPAAPAAPYDPQATCPDCFGVKTSQQHWEICILPLLEETEPQ